MHTLAAVEAELSQLEAEVMRRLKPLQLLDGLPEKLLPFLHPSRYKAAHGGRGSAKSWTFAKLLIEKCRRNPGTRWICAREIQESLKESVKKLLEDQITHAGLGSEFTITREDIRTPGGGVIIFIGMQNHTAESIKSLEGFDGAWFEEAQRASERSLTLLRPTLRKPGSEIWFSWNPDEASDPVDAMFRGPAGPPPDSIVIEVNFRDNPNFPEVLQKEMEWDQRRDPDKYAHVWLGKYEKLSASRVFRNWIIDEFEAPPRPSYLFGADWGFSIDPSVLVRGYVSDTTLYIDYESYQVGCEIDDTPSLFDQIDNGMARKWEIIADSARPETISYMQRHGYPRIVAARKGAGSVEEGINFLKLYDIVVHKRCVHCIDELSSYSYKKHPKTDEIMPVLEDKKNHVIDAMRYMVEKLHKGKDWVVW